MPDSISQIEMKGRICDKRFYLEYIKSSQRKHIIFSLKRYIQTGSQIHIQISQLG